MSNNGYDQQWLDLENSLGSRPAFHGTVEDIRQQFAAVGQLIGPLFPSPDPSLIVRDEILKSGLNVRVYTPKTPRTPLTPAKPLPISVYYHGGGFIMGNLDAEDADCRYIAQHTPCVIVAVDYRHAPEYTLNDILDDALEGYEWAWRSAEDLGGDQDCLFPIGSSAGGCLSLAVTNSLIRQGLRSKVRGVVALSPIAAHPGSNLGEYQYLYNSYSENATDVPVINRQVLDVFFKAAQVDPLDAIHFATLSDRLKEFPRTWMVTCEKDPLRDDGVVLENMLSAQGVVVQRKHYKGFGHCFWIFPQLDKRMEFLADVVNGVKFVIQGQ